MFKEYPTGPNLSMVLALRLLGEDENSHRRRLSADVVVGAIATLTAGGWNSA